MKENDFFAVALNTEGSGITPNDLRLYGINPDNTGLREKDFYKDIPRIQERFKTSDGKFDESAFSAFYNSLKREYSDFAQNDYIDNLINNMPSSAEDVFSLGNSNINDDSVKIISSRDPNRHQIGIGNIFQSGEAAFSEREVAQAYNVLDENGNELDWSPNDNGGIFKSLFRPTLALAEWEDDGYHIENGEKVFHYKGEHKYDKDGNPRYQKVSGEIYDRDILHWGDTVTREGSFLNKIDPFDFDGVKTSPGKIIYSTFVRFLPYLTPAADLFGALEAAKALSKTVPVVAKSINGLFSTNQNSFGKTMTSVENWAKRFDQSTSDEAEGKFFAFENIMQQVVDSAKQLYSQGLIQKIPQMLSKHPSMKSMKIASILSTAYLASTSAEDVYGDYIRAGVNEKWAGLGALATMGAFYGFMSNEYFKEFLFNDPAIELPELKRVVRNEIKTSMQAVEKRIAENEKIAVEAVKKGLLPTWTGEKWYNKTYNVVAGALNKVIPKVFDRDNTYLVRAFNEGLEEVMEEGATDLIKGLTLGANELGFNVKDENADNVDFGFSPEDFLTRYSQAFLGGAFGGAIFEGLQQWNNKVLHRKQKLISDLALDEQLMWYIRNNRTNELLDIVDSFEKRGKFGSKNLSLDYEIEDGKIVWASTDNENNSQNTQLANALRQRIRVLQSELIALNFVESDNEILQKAVSTIEKEAKSAGFKDVNEYKEKRLRDERIDFLKQRGIDKLILSDVADMQYNMRILSEDIAKRKSDLITKAGDNHKPSEDELNADPIVKLKQEKFDEVKKSYDELLKGKQAHEYLALGLFAGDDALVDLYLATKAEDGKKSYYLTDLKKYVRAKYNINLDELIEKTGGRNEEGKSEIEDYFQQEFDDMQSAQDIFRIRYAYELHKRLGKVINPVLKEQIKNYSGYKSDPDRNDLINILATEETINKAKLDYDIASKEVDDYVNNNIDTFRSLNLINDAGQLVDEDAAMAADPEFAKRVNNFRKAHANYAFYTDPKTVLSRTFQDDKSKKELLDRISFGDTSELFRFLKTYYKHLNDEKIVSEFSDDFYRIGIASAANIMRKNLSETLISIRNRVLGIVYQIPEEYINVLERLSTDSSLETITTEVQLKEDDAVEEHTLREIFQYLHDNVLGDSSNVFYFNGKKARLLEHLKTAFDYDTGVILTSLDSSEQDTLLEAFDNASESEPSITFDQDQDETWIDSLARDIASRAQINAAIVNDSDWKTIDSRLNGVFKDFERDPDYGLSSYQDAIEMIKTLIDEGKFNPGVDAKTWIDNTLFENGINLVNEVQELKNIRSNMVHTPILDWIRAMSSEFGGVRQDLLDILEKEIKGLVTSKTLDDYVIENPFAKDELEYLEHALDAASAMVRGAVPLRGANFFINQLIEKEEDKLPYLDNNVLGDVYAQDLGSMIDRVAALNALNRNNSKGVVRARLESMAVHAPKLFKTFLKKGTNPSETPKDNPFWIGQFENILHINLIDLWNDRFDLDTVSIDNLDAFWTAVRSFMDDLYTAVGNVDWEKVSAEQGNASVNEILTNVLFGRVTDSWKLKNAPISNDPNNPIEDMDVALTIAALLSVDPKETFGRMKTVASRPGQVKPFWDQMLAIIIGFGKTKNREFFNEIAKTIQLTQSAKANNPADADFNAMSAEDGSSARAYFDARPLIENALNIDGASGTGKSTCILKFVHDMNELDNEKPVTVVCAKYGKRLESLKDILGAADENCFTFSQLCKRIIGRELNSDDFENRAIAKSEDDIVTGHAQVLKQSVIDLIRDKGKWGYDGTINVYIDESGLFSEAELVFLSEASKLGKVNLIFAGDKMQNGATTSEGLTSGIADCVILGTPRLTTSMRVGNWGMLSNLAMLESDLADVVKVYTDTPWITAEIANRQLSGILKERTFKYTEKADVIYGFNIVDDGDSALDKLKSYKKQDTEGPKIAIITDKPDKYSSQASADVEVISVEEVQGGEYDYVLADIENIDETRPDNYYKKVYTIISRAKTGGYIVNGLGSKFNKSENDPLAATIVNPSSSVEGDADMSLDKYNVFWTDKLMKNEVWNAPTTSGGTSISSSSSSSGSSSSGSSGSSGGSSVPGSSAATTGGSTPSMPAFNEETYKNQVINADSDDEIIQELTTDRSKQRKEDIRNYRKYHAKVKSEGNNGSLVDFKGYIDWLFDDSDSILFGNNNFNIDNDSISDDKKQQIKEAIRDLSLDLFQLDDTKLKEKWRNNPAVRDKWINATDAKLADAIKTKIINSKSDTLELYAVRDGAFSYLYFIADGKAIPIMRISGGTHSGWISINKKNQLFRFTPLTMLSSDGKAVTDPYSSKFTRYANISESSYLLNIDPNRTEFADPDTKRFATHAQGIGQVVVQSTFGDRPDNFLIPNKVNDVIHRLDSTGESDHRARFMAVSKHITFEKYLELANYLKYMWHTHKPLDDNKRNELTKYINSNDYQRLLEQVDDGERIKTLRHASILQKDNRDLLVSALMRFFLRDGADKTVASKFFNNLNNWVSSAEYTSKNNATGTTITRQHGIKFSLRSKYGSSIDFHIVLNNDKKSYDVYYKVFDEETSEEVETVLIENLGNEDYFNFTSFDPVAVSEKLIEKIFNTIKEKTEYSDSAPNTEKEVKEKNKIKYRAFLSFAKDYLVSPDYNSLFKDGRISFGLITKRLKNENEKVELGWYNPFDSDVAELMDGISYDSKIEEFLKSDSIFKYNIIVGVHVDGVQLDPAAAWLTASRTNDDGTSWDIIDIIPPCYELNGFSEIEDTSALPTLGTLGHTGSTDDKSKIMVTETQDDNGKAKSYVFDKPFRISKDALDEYIDTNSLRVSTEFIIKEINRIGDNFYLKIDGNNIEISEDNIKKLLKGMTLQTIGTNVIAKNGDWFLRKTDDGIILSTNSEEFTDIKIIDYDRKRLLLYADGNVVSFANIDQSVVNDANWNKLSEGTYIGIADTGDVLYYNNDNLIVISNNQVSTKSVSLVGNELRIDGIPVEADSSIINKLKSLLPVRPQKSDIVTITSIKFEGKAVDFDDATLINDPNKWALNNAEKLGGVWTWTGKSWKLSKSNQIAWAYAKLVQSEIGNNPIDTFSNIKSLHYKGDSEVIINDRTFKIEHVGDNYRLVEIIPTDADIDEFINRVSALNDEKITEIFRELIDLHTKLNTGKPYNAQRMGTLYAQLNTNPTIGKITGFFVDNIADKLDNTIICRL